MLHLTRNRHYDIFPFQVKYADQQKELIRVKREIIHDKQIELPIKKITDNSIYYRVPSKRIVRKDGIPNAEMNYNDPFYKDQWYVVSCLFFLSIVISACLAIYYQVFQTNANFSNKKFCYTLIVLEFDRAFC